MPDQTTGTGIAGAMNHAAPALGTCYVCAGPAENPHSIRALPGVGLAVACSPACAADKRFRTPAEVEVEQLRVDCRRLREDGRRLRELLDHAITERLMYYANVERLHDAFNDIRSICAQSHPDAPDRQRPYTALSQIDQIARQASA